MTASIKKPTVALHACSCATIWEFCIKFCHGIEGLAPNFVRAKFCHSKYHTFLIPPSPESGRCPYLALASVLMWIPLRLHPFQLCCASVCVRFDFRVRPSVSFFPI